MSSLLQATLPSLVLLVALLASPANAHPPYRIAVDAKGNVFFLDFPSRLVVRVCTDGTWEPWADLTAHGVRTDPHSIVMAPNGDLLVAETYGNRLWRIPSKGRITLDPLSTLLEKDGKGCVQDMAFGPRGDLYLLRRRDASPKREGFFTFQKYSKGRLAPLGRLPTARANLYVSSFTVADDGIVLLTVGDHLARLVNGRLEEVSLTVVDPAGEVVSASPFKAAWGVTAGPGRRLVVCDMRGHRIHAVDAQGRLTLIAGTGKRGVRDGAAAEATFDSPYAAATRPDGAVVIADQVVTEARKWFHVLRVVKDGRVTTLARIPVRPRSSWH